MSKLTEAVHRQANEPLLEGFGCVGYIVGLPIAILLCSLPAAIVSFFVTNWADQQMWFLEGLTKADKATPLAIIFASSFICSLFVLASLVIVALLASISRGQTALSFATLRVAEKTGSHSEEWPPS